MTTNLMTPRYIQLTDIPIGVEEPLKEGTIYTLCNEGKTQFKLFGRIWLPSDFDAYPKIFRLIFWWEHRSIDQMPGYVKDVFFPITIPDTKNPFYGHIFKVTEHFISELADVGCEYIDSKGELCYLAYNQAEPCTEQEYNDYINSKK